MALTRLDKPLRIGARFGKKAVESLSCVVNGELQAGWVMPGPGVLAVDACSTTRPSEAGLRVQGVSGCHAA